MMRSAIVISLLSFAEQLHAKEQVVNHIGDAQGSIMNQLINNMFDRALEASPTHNDWDRTTLGKPGHVVRQPRTSRGSLPHTAGDSAVGPEGGHQLPGQQKQSSPTDSLQRQSSFAEVRQPSNGFAGLYSSSQLPRRGPFGANSALIVRSAKTNVNWPEETGKVYRWEKGKVHRWITEEDPTFKQIAYIVKTPEKFYGTRTKGVYPGSSRVQFTLPGKDDAIKTIEILRSSNNNPSFGAVKVKLPLDAEVKGENGRLVVQRVSSTGNAGQSQIASGDIIRAVSVPETEDAQAAQKESPWWDRLNPLLSQLPDAEEGMVILDGKSPGQFNAALQENIRVQGKQAQVVLLIERPVKFYNNDKDGWMSGLPAMPQRPDPKLAPQLIPIPVPTDSPEEEALRRRPPPRSYMRRFDVPTRFGAVADPDTSSHGKTAVELGLLGGTNKVTRGGWASPGQQAQRDQYRTNVGQAIDRLRGDHSNIPKIAPGLELAVPAVKMSLAQVSGIAWKGFWEYVKFWRFFHTAVETLSTESRSEVMSVSHIGNTIRIRWRLVFTAKNIAPAAAAAALSAAALAFSAATGDPTYAAAHLSHDASAAAAGVAAAADTVKQAFSNVRTANTEKDGSSAEKIVDFNSIYELDPWDGRIVSHSLEFREPREDHGLLGALRASLNVGGFMQPAVAPA